MPDPLIPNADHFAASAIPTHVYMLVELWRGLRVAGDLLSTRWVVPTAPAHCEIVFPSGSGWHHGIGLPALGAPDVGVGTEALEQHWRRHLADSDIDEPHPDDIRLWGPIPFAALNDWDYVVMHADPDQAIVVVNYDAVVASELGTSAGVDAIPKSAVTEHRARSAFVEATRDAVAAWLQAVSAWIDVLSGSLTRPDRLALRGHGRLSVDALVINATTGEPERFVDRGWKPPAPSSLVTVSRNLWEAATERVAADESPPLVHLLLRDARAADFAHDLRRAVLDAACATEVALTESIRKAKSGHVAAKEIDAALTRRNGLMDLYNLHSIAFGPIPGVSREQLNQQLAKVRNEVAHKGREPNQEQAELAIQVATRLVGALTPIAQDRS